LFSWIPDPVRREVAPGASVSDTSLRVVQRSSERAYDRDKLASRQQARPCGTDAETNARTGNQVENEEQTPVVRVLPALPRAASPRPRPATPMRPTPGPPSEGP
jgi:hypothetical protein